MSAVLIHWEEHLSVLTETEHWLTEFYILLTVHIITIFVNNLKHNSFSCICLFQFSTCFEQPSAHHQYSQLYQYDLWYMSLYVGDIYQMSYWYNWLSWWWAHGCSKHVENWNKQIQQKDCVRFVIYKNKDRLTAVNTARELHLDDDVAMQHETPLHSYM